MAFTPKQISLTFALGTGAFGESGQNTVTLSGLRVSAQIVKAGGTSMGRAELRINGMTLSMMNQLAALNTQVMMQRKNRVTVMAGDGSGMPVVFDGQITEGWIDANASPEVSFHVTALAGLLAAVAQATPTSYPSGADCATIMAALAKQANLGFEDNGVSVKLPKCYFHGSPRQQIKDCAEAADINWVIDDGGQANTGTLAIWPKGGSRLGLVPVISAANGMVGYPSFTATGIAVNTLFNPTLKFGGTVQVVSQLSAACGKWFTSALSHSLQSETPGGAWFTSFQGAPLYNTNVVP